MVKAIRTPEYAVSLDLADDEFRAHLATTRVGPGLDLVHVRLEADRPTVPPLITLSWTHPIVGVQGMWHPHAGRDRGLPVDGGPGFVSNATTSAPVLALYGGDGANRLTFALSEALERVEVRAGVREETAEFHCSASIFGSETDPRREYQATLRLDTRPVPYFVSLREVQAWWATLPGYQPAVSPEFARLPLYSTWYSFHQELSPEAVERQCRMAKALGCQAVIVDDGWQTANNQRGYAYCGDWEPAPEKIADMRSHVARVHAFGLKYLLWYAVPFVGSFSKAFGRFAGNCLRVEPGFGGAPGQVAILDPRFPPVREYLIETYERAVREWDVDGLKLDFVDAFGWATSGAGARQPDQAGSGRDYDSAPAAVDRLLRDVYTRLRAIKPDVAIEFRQSYVGPSPRAYANMFRAADCPSDAVENRIRTIDIRLLCGSTAAQSDMLMWRRDESVESAALQLLNVLFAVPQVSVRLDSLPADHLAMLRFWLGLWREHRDVLLDGELSPLHPELLYPVVSASNPDKRVIAAYADAVLDLGAGTPDLVILVNATPRGRLVVEVGADLGNRELAVMDCRGEQVERRQVSLTPGLHAIAVPPSGVAFLRSSRA